MHHDARGRVPSVDFGQMNSRPLAAAGLARGDVRGAAASRRAQVLAWMPDGRDMKICATDDPPVGAESCISPMAAQGCACAWTDDFGSREACAGPGAARVIETVRKAAMGLKDAGAVIEETSETWGDPGWPAGVVLSWRPGQCSSAQRCRPSRTSSPLAKPARRSSRPARLRAGGPRLHHRPDHPVRRPDAERMGGRLGQAWLRELLHRWPTPPPPTLSALGQPTSSMPARAGRRAVP